jgi:hypothetical protein
MDINTYALEMMVRDRLERLRQEAAAYALATRAHRPPRAPLGASLGLLLIGLGRWLRRDRRSLLGPPAARAGLAGPATTGELTGV